MSDKIENIQHKKNNKGVFTKVDLSEIVYESPKLEFATGKNPYVLLWWAEPKEVFPYEKILGKKMVVNFEGKKVDALQKGTDLLKREFLNYFPEYSYRQKWNNFIGDADGWGFMDNKYGFKISEDKTFNIRGAVWHIELWSLSGKKEKIWEKKTDPIKGTSKCRLVEFINWNDEECILVVCGGKNALIIGQYDGNIKSVISYGIQPTEESLKNSQKKFDIDCPEGVRDCGLEFWANSCAYNDKKRLIACGDSNSKRVRIVSVDPPNDVIYELNSDENPFLPRGGKWSVPRLKFNGDGNFLVVEYLFHGRGTAKEFYPTEIYNVETMELLWVENETDLKSVTVSPDGTKLAFMKGKVFKIGPFIHGDR